MSTPILTKGSTGPDVRVLQRALNNRSRSRGIASLQVDGEIGPLTWRIWEEVYEALGGKPGTFAGGKTNVRAKRRYRLVRFPGTRTPAERRRARAWNSARKAAGTALQRALAWSSKQLGTMEHPAGSNTGPKIRDWLLGVGLSFGAPWCGAYAAAVAKVYGITLTDRARYCPYIEADAKASVGGYDRWTTSIVEAERALKAGHLVFTLFHFGGGEAKHVGALRAIVNGLVRNDEGNTSLGTAGSQDNGGRVATRDRDFTQVRGFAILKAAPR